MNHNLKIARIKNNLTQAELAKKVGITNKYLSQLETGKSKNPSKPLMEKIAKVLNCTVQELFFNEDQKGGNSMKATYKKTTNFLTAEEVAEILGVSLSTAYRIIKRLNEELKAQGFITVAGKISKRYFEQKVAL